MRKLFKALSIALGLGILVLLIFYAGPARFIAILAGSDIRFIFIAFVLSTINIFTRTLKWQALLRGVSLRNLVPVQMLGGAISNFSPGKVAEPVKSVILKLTTGIPVSATLPSVIWEKLIDVIVLIVFSLFALVFFINLDKNLFLVSLASYVVFAFALAVLILFLNVKSFQLRMFNFLKKFPVVNKLSDSFIKTFEESHISRKQLLYSFIFTLVTWVLEGLVIYFSLRAIGVSLHPAIVLCVFALATIIGFATALPGGIGSTDVVMVILLGTLGVDKSLAVAGFLLSRLLALWYVNVLGGMSFIYLARKFSLDYKKIMA